MSHKCSIFGVFILLVGSLIFPSDSSGQIKGYFPKPGPDDTEEVSLVQLIAQPEKFEGKRVRFVGFLSIEFEGNAIYLHREDFDHGIAKNGLWVDIPSDMTKQQRDEVNMRYVICTGVFTARWRGHMGMFSGEIRKQSLKYPNALTDPKLFLSTASKQLAEESRQGSTGTDTSDTVCMGMEVVGGRARQSNLR